MYSIKETYQEKEMKTLLNVTEIMERIPHRYPFLLVDKVIGVKEGESITTVKNVTMSEEFFQGHFPNHPIMPGVLILEAMAQSAAILVNYAGDITDKVVYFSTIEKAQFRKPVTPGDQIIMEVEVERNRSNFWKFSGTAYVLDERVANCNFAATVVENK